VKEKKSGAKVLLVSVIASTPGPLMAGIGLLFGRSSTQVAHFIRKCTHLVGLIVSYFVYRTVEHDEECCVEKRDALERMSNIVVGLMTCLGGIIMLSLTILSNDISKGNVVPGLILSVVGAIMNVLLWCKYHQLSVEEDSSILDVQARLYKTKSLVDICISVTLLTIVIFPTAAFSHCVDLGGSIIMSIYLINRGVKTIGTRLNTIPRGH
jgi:hypothetical protein